MSDGRMEGREGWKERVRQTWDENKTKERNVQVYYLIIYIIVLLFY